MTSAILAVWLSTFARAAAAPAPAPAAAAPAVKPADVKASTAPAAATELADPSQIYTAEKLRDPFRQLSANSGDGAATHSFTADDFNIHNLSLRGMMKDRRADYALFADPAFGVTFVLRGGRLYDPKGRPVPGVTGGLDIRRKTAHLMTKDSDVQTFRLGEEGAN